MKKYLVICLLIFSILGLNSLSKNYRYICLASFINEKLASAFLENVKELNIDAVIERFAQSGAAYYRVLYNKPFEDKKTAQKEFEALYESLKELELKNLWVTSSDKLFDKTAKTEEIKEKDSNLKTSETENKSE